MQVLTLKELKNMEPHAIIKQGTAILEHIEGAVDIEDLVKVKYIAVRGRIHDWTIYAGSEDRSFEYIRQFGHKLYNKENIIKVIPCMEDAFDMYRF